MKKIYALFPSEREKDCTHQGTVSWTGRIPCTGRLRCWMCGTEMCQRCGDPIPEGSSCMCFDNGCE